MSVFVVADAETTADVSATVTAQLVSVSVSDGSIAYGILELNTTTTTVGTDLQTATNDGNVNIDLGIRSSDAVSSSTPWELAASAGLNEFTYEFSIDGGSNWAAFNVDNATYSTLASDVDVDGTQTFDLRIGTPTASTDSVEHTVTVTVLATAS